MAKQKAGTRKTAVVKKTAAEAGKKRMVRAKEPAVPTKETAGTVEALAVGAAKARKRTYTKKRLTALLDLMLTQFAEQLSGRPLSYSAGDGLKMMQMRESAEPERPTEVKVGWVEETRP